MQELGANRCLCRRLGREPRPRRPLSRRRRGRFRSGPPDADRGAAKRARRQSRSSRVCHITAREFWTSAQNYVRGRNLCLPTRSIMQQSSGDSSSPPTSTQNNPVQIAPTLQISPSQPDIPARPNSVPSKKRGLGSRLFLWNRRARPNPLIISIPPVRYRDPENDANWATLCNDAEQIYERYLYYLDIVLLRDMASTAFSALTVITALLTAYSSTTSAGTGSHYIVQITALLTVLCASMRGFLSANSRYIAGSTASKIYGGLIAAKASWIKQHNRSSSGEALKAALQCISETSHAAENEHLALEQSGAKPKEG